MTGKAPYPGLLILKPGSCCCAKTVFKLRNLSLLSNSFKGMLLPSYFWYLQKRSSLDRRKQKQKKKERKEGGRNGEREKGYFCKFGDVAVSYLRNQH